MLVGSRGTMGAHSNTLGLHGLCHGGLVQMHLAHCASWSIFWSEWTRWWNDWAHQAHTWLQTATHHEWWLYARLLIPLILVETFPQQVPGAIGGTRTPPNIGGPQTGPTPFTLVDHSIYKPTPHTAGNPLEPTCMLICDQVLQSYTQPQRCHSHKGQLPFKGREPHKTEFA